MSELSLAPIQAGINRGNLWNTGMELRTDYQTLILINFWNWKGNFGTSACLPGFIETGRTIGFHTVGITPNRCRNTEIRAEIGYSFNSPNQDRNQKWSLRVSRLSYREWKKSKSRGNSEISGSIPLRRRSNFSPNWAGNPCWTESLNQK